MIQNVNSQIPVVTSQEMWRDSRMPWVGPGVILPQQLPIPCVAPCPLPQPGVAPVYNSIPYNPVYGNYGQPQQQTHAYSPKISTVSIEMNGLQPPQVPGLNDFQQQQMPVYPGMTQMYQPQPAYCPYPVMPQAIPQDMQPQQVAPQPQQIAPPAPQYVQPQQAAPQPQQVAPQAPAAEQVQNIPPANPQQDQEAVKPLMEAINLITPKQGAPELTMEQQEKAIQTIAQFARVAEAANQLAIADPSNPDVKQTKEKVDSMIKPNLIKEETFLGLADIATKDTSKLTGEDKKKADQNRTISMWTLSMLQKLFKQEMNEEAKKINIPPISMNEVPGIVQVADIVKKDANPNVREAGIAALINLADPQDKKDVETMKTILGEAQKDSAKNVSDVATKVLEVHARTGRFIEEDKTEPDKQAKK